MSKKEKKNWFDVKAWRLFAKKIYQHPATVKTLIILGAILIFLAGAIFTFNLSYSQKIFPKTYIGGISLGGKTLSEAETILSEAVQQAGTPEVLLTFENKEWTLATTDLDLNYDIKQSAQTAWSVGRHGGLKKICQEQIRAIFNRNQYPAALSYNQAKLDEYLLNLAKEIDIPEKDAGIIIKDLKPQIEPEKVGRRLEIAENSQLVLAVFGQLRAKSNQPLMVKAIQPRITQENAQKAYNDTLKILTNNFTLKTDKKDFSLGNDKVAEWLDFVGMRPDKAVLGESTEYSSAMVLPEWILAAQLRQEKIRQYVAEIAQEINQEPKDAKFNVASGRAVAFQLAQTGYELDQEAAIKIINEAILAHQTEIELPVKITEPAIKANSAAELGIREVVGSGTTNFAGSPNNRRHNIATGAKALHGIIVKPGEEFSTLAHISPVNAENGYLPELVIKENETKPEFGGGLCQVSTTLFRAALDAGLKITERANHSYRVSYYEPPIGMDATIYEPRPDFKFVNNMAHPILIQSYVDGNEITFTFYGTEDERQVEVSTPVGYDYTGAGDDVYVEDPSLAPGEIKQVERAHGGAKAYFHYKVTLNGEVLQDETFRSSYVSWPARFLYGPGTTLPTAPPAE